MKLQKKICFVITVPSALRAFMADHIRALSNQHEVTIFCNLSDDSCHNIFDESVRLVHIPFERKIRLWRDFKCFCSLFARLVRGRFDSVHSILPKTGLLAMTAGWMARTPVRIHMFTGQVWVTRSGLWRTVLKAMDAIIAHSATNIYADSSSQRDFLIKEKVLRSCGVLGDGSVNGVDTDRFKADSVARNAVRGQFDIPTDAFLFGFLGRLNRDKGVLDLVNAFAALDIREQAYLLLAGRDEEGIEHIVHTRFSNVWKRIRFAGFTSEPERMYAAFDILCMPSYREGFCSSVIEAAACGVPALASRIYGLTDAVEEDVTGLMHEPGNVSEIADGLLRYATDRALCKQFGRAARERVVRKFSRDRLVAQMVHEYERMLGNE